MRKAGSIGAGTSPGRVWKGTRMAGRMGNDKVTIKNLELIKVDADRNLLYVSGAVPGPNKILFIYREQIMKVDLFNKEGKKTSQITLNDKVFGIKPNEHTIYLSVKSD